MNKSVVPVSCSRRRLFAAFGAIAAFSIGTRSAGAGEMLKLGHDSPLDFPYQPAAEAFKQQVEAKTQGRITVQIFPNAQLGDEDTMINGLKIGSVDAMFTSTAPLSSSVKEIDLFSLPFIFKNVEQALKVANGPIGAHLAKLIDAAVGAQVVGWGSVGERDMWDSRRPIKTVADLKGLKMRIQRSAIQKDTYTALGAEPTPMSFSELFTALQTGVVDGADNGPLDVESSKFYQVTKYLTETRHFILLTPLLISDRFLAKISAGDREIIMDAGQSVVGTVTSKAKEQNTAALTQLKDQGLQILSLSDADREEFVKRVQEVYKKNADRVGGMAVVKQALATE